MEENDNEFDDFERKNKYDKYHTNPYAQYSRDHNYLYVYMTFDYGWGLYPSKSLVFLYNSSDNTLKWAECEEPFTELGVKTLDKKIVIESVFTHKPYSDTEAVALSTDVSYYSVYMSSACCEKELMIEEDEKRRYPFFKHFFKIMDAHFKATAKPYSNSDVK